MIFAKNTGISQPCLIFGGHLHLNPMIGNDLKLFGECNISVFTWFHVFQKLINDYPLVMTNIAIENHQFQWVNPL